MKILNEPGRSISILVPQDLQLIRFDFIDYCACGSLFQYLKQPFDLVTKYVFMLFILPPGKTLVLSPDLPLKYMDWNKLHPQTQRRGSLG